MILDSMNARGQSSKVVFFILALSSIASPPLQAAEKRTASSSKMTRESKSAPILSLETFLEDVRLKNENYRAAEGLKEAADGASEEAGLQLKPQFFATATMTSDAKPSPFFRYERVENNAYSAGLQQQFSFGLQTKFTYIASDSSYVGTIPRYFDARPQIEASLPLWRNAFGRELRRSIEAAELGAQARAEGQSAMAHGALLEAEAQYWKLALAREALKVSRDAHTRAKTVFDWSERRVRLSLADRADGLQAAAQLKARSIDLKQAEDDERSARLSFNLARGLLSDKVSEELMTINSALVSGWKTPESTGDRADVRAARLQLAAAEASARAAEDRTKSSVDVFALYAFNSAQKSTESDAVADSWGGRPTSTVGLRLSVPLDQDATSRVQNAWSLEAQSNRLLIDRRAKEQERDWADLVSRFQLAKEKTRLYEDLEKAQLEKLEHERARQKAGRATLAQVILFESDYQQTQFARIRNLTELLNLNAQIKLYGVRQTSSASVAPSDERLNWNNTDNTR